MTTARATVHGLERDDAGRLLALATCSVCSASVSYVVGGLDAVDFDPQPARCSCADLAELIVPGDLLRLRLRVLRRQAEEDAAELAAAEAARVEVERHRARTMLAGRPGAERAGRLADVLAELAEDAGGSWSATTADLLAVLLERPELAGDRLTDSGDLLQRLRSTVLGLALAVHGLALTPARKPGGAALVWTVAPAAGPATA